MAFWLSHHSEEELHRTYAIGGVRVCARCLGLYRVLLATLIYQFARRAPLEWELDLPWALLLPLPALLDWAYGRFRPRAGTNILRTATGILLGMGLGRTLYVHFQRPFPTALLLQGALVTGIAIPVILITYSRQRRPVDHRGDSYVEKGKETQPAPDTGDS